MRWCYEKYFDCFLRPPKGRPTSISGVRGGSRWIHVLFGGRKKTANFASGLFPFLVGLKAVHPESMDLTGESCWDVDASCGVSICSVLILRYHFPALYKHVTHDLKPLGFISSRRR